MDEATVLAFERLEARLDDIWNEQRRTVEKLNRLILLSRRTGGQTPADGVATGPLDAANEGEAD